MFPARRVPSFAVLTLLLVAAACQGNGPGADATATPVNSTSASTSPTQVASASIQPTPQPSDDLGAFSCNLPVTGTATADRAQIVDVRVGTHAGYDRVVFEFADGAPAFTLKQATPPLLTDGSGATLDVSGSAFWQLVMRDASRTDLDGHTVLTKTDFKAGFAKLSELIEGGDFEAVSTWYFGLNGESCVRVLALDNPSRLVFDIKQ